MGLCSRLSLKSLLRLFGFAAGYMWLHHSSSNSDTFHLVHAMTYLQGVTPDSFPAVIAGPIDGLSTDNTLKFQVYFICHSTRIFKNTYRGTKLRFSKLHKQRVKRQFKKHFIHPVQIKLHTSVDCVLASCSDVFICVNIIVIINVIINKQLVFFGDFNSFSQNKRIHIFPEVNWLSWLFM